MVVLVTGATGLIGKALVAQLLQKGHVVHYLTTSPNKLQTSPNYKGFLWNPKLGQLDEQALVQVEVIFHLAGATIAKRWTTSYKNEILHSRVQSSQTLFKFLQAKPHQVKQLIAASGTAIYPNHPTKIYHENQAVASPQFLGQVVQAWEAATSQFTALGIAVCQLRTGVVYAPKGGALPQMVLPIKWGLGSVMGQGNQVQSWIHLQDSVGLYLYAMEHAWVGPYNAVSPEPISNRKQTKLLAKLLNRPLWLPATPQWVMRLFLGEMHQLLFTDARLSCQKALDAGYEFQFPTAKSALKNCLA